MAMIRRNVELETKLIDDLLDLSRITSGKLTLRLEISRPEHCCASGLRYLPLADPGKGIALLVDLDPAIGR